LRLPVLLDEPLAERAVEPVLQLRMSVAPELQRVPEALPLQAERESERAQVESDPRQTAAQQAQEARGAGPAAQLPVPEELVRRLKEPEALQAPRERRVQPEAPQQAQRSARQLRVAVPPLQAANGPLWQPLPGPSFPAQPGQLPLLRPPPDHGSACGLSPRPIHRSSWSESSFR
jgi:hypothetical protein